MTDEYKVDWTTADARKKLPVVEYSIIADGYMCCSVFYDEENSGEQIGSGPTPSEAFQDWMRKNL